MGIIFFYLTISKPSPLSPIPHHLYSNLFSMSKIIQSLHTLFFNHEGIITDLISVVWKLISYWPKELYTHIQHIHRRDRFFSATNPWTKVVKNRNSSSWYQSNKKKKQLTRNNSAIRTTATSHTSTPCSISHKTPQITSTTWKKIMPVLSS